MKLKYSFHPHRIFFRLPDTMGVKYMGFSKYEIPAHAIEKTKKRSLFIIYYL